MQASKAAYEIAGPILYRELELDEENIKYVVMGLSPKSRQYLKVKPQKPIKGADGETIKRKGYVWTAARHERKAYLFSFTESITVDTTVRHLTWVNAIVTWIACKNAQDEDEVSGGYTIFACPSRLRSCGSAERGTKGYKGKGIRQKMKVIPPKEIVVSTTAAALVHVVAIAECL